MSVALKASSGTVGSKPSDAGRKVSDVPDSIPALSSWIRGNLADHRVSTESVLGTFDSELLSTRGTKAPQRHFCIMDARITQSGPAPQLV